jgi:hypothetical protein
MPHSFAMTFNTLDATRRLVAAGLDRPKAEAVVDEIAAAQADLVTKPDLDSALAVMKSDLDTALARMETRLVAWVVGSVLLAGLVGHLWK